MGQALDMSIVAEGVETAEQLQSLQNLDCHLAQGYHLARPQPPEAILALVYNRLTGH